MSHGTNWHKFVTPLIFWLYNRPLFLPMSLIRTIFMTLNDKNKFFLPFDWGFEFYFFPFLEPFVQMRPQVWCALSQRSVSTVMTKSQCGISRHDRGPIFLICIRYPFVI